MVALELFYAHRRSLEFMSDHDRICDKNIAHASNVKRICRLTLKCFC